VYPNPTADPILYMASKHWQVLAHWILGCQIRVAFFAGGVGD
jgi:hypothetical protein